MPRSRGGQPGGISEPTAHSLDFCPGSRGKAEALLLGCEVPGCVDEVTSSAPREWNNSYM